jgi:2-iminobutanoate/2-iminopropanoate deaminase
MDYDMRSSVSTKRAPSPRGFYSQAVRAGSFLFISGQLPLAEDNQLVGKSAAEQTTKALENVRAIVEAGHATLADLVQVVVYISEISYWPEVNTVYEAFLSGLSPAPARIVVPVKDLHYGAKVEIQAIAYIDDSK